MSINTSKVVSKPTSWSELASLFGCSQDVGTICTSDSINPWARYKPFVYNKLFFKKDEDDVSTDRDEAIVEKGFGLTPYKMNVGASNWASFKAKIDGKMNGWIYQKPTGGSSSPYRIADFIGYSHLVRFPINQITYNTSVIQDYGGKDTITVRFNTQPGGMGVSHIGFNELNLVGRNLYPTLRLFLEDANGNLVGGSIQQYNKPIDECIGVISWSFDVNNDYMFQAATYKVLPMLVTKIDELVTPTSTLESYTLPEVNFGSIKVDTLESLIDIGIIYPTYISGTIRFTLTLKNKYNEALGVGTFVADVLSTSGNILGSKLTTAKTISAGETSTQDVSVSVGSLDSGTVVRIRVSYGTNSSWYRQLSFGI